MRQIPHDLRAGFTSNLSDVSGKVPLGAINKASAINRIETI